MAMRAMVRAATSRFWRAACAKASAYSFVKGVPTPCVSPARAKAFSETRPDSSKD